jgi:Flp pilus assembly protein TadD/predicted RNA-binding Zn-ribbon protein involved in translation (DUF1610 family)
VPGSTFRCPTCGEDFYYEPAPEIEKIHAGKDLRQQDLRVAQRPSAVAVECPNCPAVLLVDLSTGKAEEMGEGSVESFGQSHRSLTWDMTASEDIKQRVTDLNEQGHAARQQGAIDSAIEKFKAAIELRKHDPLSWYNLGAVLYQSGDVAGAEAAFRHAVQYDEDFANAWNNLGMILMQAGNLAEAGSCFDHGIAADPDYPKCYLGKGSLCVLQGNPSEARRYYNLALEKDPSYEPARLALAQLG